ncbi:MAG TPA: vWA domain-containing protein [Polyangiaceae bacterium]
MSICHTSLRNSSFCLVLAALAAGCTIETDDDTQGELPGIPGDPGGQAPATTINNIKPAAQFSLDASESRRVRVNLLGLIDPTTQAPIEFLSGETLFVTEDDVLKGLRVTQADASNQLPSDIVFVVDNSSSMDQEADTVADKIIEFVNLLESSGLSTKVGVVGVNGDITGAIDLHDAAGIEAYLKRSGRSGTSRTVGFDGANAATLTEEAQTMNPSFGGGENGIHGIAFAEAAFTFRQNAQRVFINFTDEPTQPANKPEWSTKTLCARWTPTTGTIHTIWSGSRSLEETASTTWTENVSENPAELSKCTPGGIVQSVASNASDLNLTTLPLTVALGNSALVEFATSDPDAAHTLKITVKNGATADGETIFEDLVYGGGSQ